MDAARATRISKLMSFVLRHDPAALGLVVEPGGWVTVQHLVDALRRGGEIVDRADVEEIVRTNDKQRFAFSAEGDRIRASQGHSISVDLGLPATVPPERLFHGTVASALESIRAAGLLPGARDFVHLSREERVARAVGARRGRPIVLAVHAGKMHVAGHVFHEADNGVWLVKQVPAAFLGFPREAKA